MKKAVFTLSLVFAAMVAGVVSSPREVSATGGISLGDRVWEDLNANGIQDPGEIGLEGIQVQLFKIGVPGQYRPSQTTGPSGAYLFTELDAGSYKLRFLIPSTMSEWSFSPAHQGSDPTVDSDAVATGNPMIAEVTGINLWFSDDIHRDAGLNYIEKCNVEFIGLTLGNRIWRDRDQNGLQNGGEAGIAGATVELWRYLPGVFPYYNQKFTGRRTTSDDTGFYSFSCLPEGDYFVAVDGLEDFERTHPYKSPDDDN